MCINAAGQIRVWGFLIEFRRRFPVTTLLVQKIVPRDSWAGGMQKFIAAPLFLGQGVGKSPKKSHFTTLRAKRATLTIGQTVLPDRSIFNGTNNDRQCQKFENSNETFWPIFKQCLGTKTLLTRPAKPSEVTSLPKFLLRFS